MLLLSVLALSLVSQGAALRVLGIFSIGTVSQNAMFKGMMEALVSHGHSVVVLSAFPHKEPLANYTDLDLAQRLSPTVSTVAYQVIPETYWDAWTFLQYLHIRCGNSVCRAVFDSQHFRDVMDGKHGQFDAFITATHGSDCFSAVAHKLGIPLIGLVPLADVPYMHERLGSIYNPSYIPNIYEPFGAKMTFWERAWNTFSVLMFQISHKRWMVDDSDAVVREFLGEDMPAVADIIRNTSLILVNRHHSYDWARPQTPNSVNVGALHVRRAWRGQRNRSLALDPSFREWMDGADDNGAIVFTMGSIMNVSTLPENAQDAIFEVLGKLPQRVIFKYEKDRANLTANVRIAPWLPQSELLAHPKAVLFITHCGLMGTQEAVVAGVPLVCIPLFGDQHHNAALYLHQGIATVVDHRDLRKETLDAAVRTVLFDSSYLQRARELSRRYLDRPLAVDEEAVYWVEYAVRHGGAPHLRPHCAHMPLYQYLLLDVAAAALAVLALLAVLVAALLRWAITLVTRNTAAATSKKRQ